MLIHPIALLSLLASLYRVHGYSDGAPEEVCETLIPRHLKPPQNTSSPYWIELSTYHMSSNHIKYNPIGGNQMMNLTLTGHQAFKGFIIQARMNDRIVGRFEPSPKYYRMLDCDEGEENTATHVENDVKSEVIFKWVPPTKVAGKVWFYSEFSTASTIPRSEFEGDYAKVFTNNNVLLNFPSNESTDYLVRKNFTNFGDSLPKQTVDSGNNKKQGIISCSGESSPSSSQGTSEIVNKLSRSINSIPTCKIGELRINSRQETGNGKNNRQINNQGVSALSFSSDGNSTGSFLSNSSQVENSGFVKVNDHVTEFSKPLRLYNKNGKPLTDRVGRPLVDIFGEKLVIFDEKGKVISDSKGDQVFNSLGESAIYPTTNLYIPPSEEEPGIPLLDINKEHILFLFDSKGHPLTDSLGRPLLSASGNPMVGIRTKSKVNLDEYEDYVLKNMYSRKPLEKCMRHVQIFDSDAKPCTDDCGQLLEGAKVICNKSGMPMCDSKGRPVYFKYGREVSLPEKENKQIKDEKEIVQSELTTLQTSSNSSGNQNFKNPELDQRFDGGIVKNMSLSERCLSDGLIKYSGESSNSDLTVSCDERTCENPSPVNNNKSKTIFSCQEVNKIDNQPETSQTTTKEKMLDDLKEGETLFLRNSLMQQCMKGQSEDYPSLKMIGNFEERRSQVELSHKTKCSKQSTETVYLFTATEKIEKQENPSSIDVAHFEAIKARKSRHPKTLPEKMYTFNFFQYFKDTFSKSNKGQGVDQYNYNEYGKPLKDIHGNLLYDKYGIPLTGAQGRKLSDAARRALRSKLRNVPKTRANITAEGAVLPLFRNESHDQFGEPVYDKYGRPLYDLAGRLIYDRFGRPLTDAFGRPLVDPIGQPLMDCEGRVLTAAYYSDSNMKLVDIFGRKIYDKRGRPLFDSYGRPKYDIFTNAIYDSCGRPATDANGKVLFDFLNRPIQPYPEKPLYKNARSHLPKYIDTVLAVPSMYRVLKYSQPLEDVFRGPLFDDLGRPLYNRLGKPVFDRYGRPLYDKNGNPLCDCYGRPLSEDIKQSDDDQTLSVVDCLKLLKVTEESSKWMISKNKVLKSKGAEDVENKNVTMKISYKNKCNKKSGKYVYTLTRVTKFASGRQGLEILEAPLSPATVAEMHRLPVDNKPLVIVVGQRHKQTVKQQ